MDYHFNLHPASTWLEFFHKAMTEKDMTLEQAKQFAELFQATEAKQALIMLQEVNQ